MARPRKPPPSRRTAAGLICDGRSVECAVATHKAAYPLARRHVVNVGSIAGEPVDSPPTRAFAAKRLDFG